MKPIPYIIFIFCLIVGIRRASAQEQFEKRFDISIIDQPFQTAITLLLRTQSAKTLGPSYNGQKKDLSFPVNLRLVNCTLDQAMDSLLVKQTIFKDYILIRHEKYDLLTLLETKSPSGRYFDRQKNRANYLHIGDKMPDSAYTFSYGDVAKRTTLRQLKKKLTVIELWNVNCKGCIENMPQMGQIQRDFNEDIQIILATKDSKDKVSELKKKVKMVAETELPIVSGEDKLASLFDYFLVPKQVWIDEAGTVVYITNSSIADAKNISDFLAQRRLKIPELKDTVIGTSTLRDLNTALGDIKKRDLGVSAYLAPHQSLKYEYGAHSSKLADSDTVKSLMAQRYSAFDLYREAYYGFGNAGSPDIRIVNDLKDQNRLKPDPIMMENYFDLEVKVKNHRTTVKQFYGTMKNLLDTYFNIQSHAEKKMVTCFVLVSLKTSRTIKQKMEGTTGIIVKKQLLTANNVTLSALMRQLGHLWLNDTSPLVNETTYDPDKKIRLTMHLDLENHLAETNRFLATSGLKILKTQRIFKTVILKESKP